MVNYYKSYQIIDKIKLLNQKPFNIIGVFMNRTFSIIKPDATKRNITGAINKTGYTIIK